MIKKENFNALIERAMKDRKHFQMRPVIAKELLHYDILFALDNESLLDKLTFQGGTCLRLCYNASRFSEDLYFAGGKTLTTKTLIHIKSCLEHYIGARYGLEITIKEPKEMASEPELRDIKVDKWQVSITTEPARKDLPKQKVKIEVANIPAYSKTPRTLQLNYDFLPDGYDDLLIMSETLDEIMADKLISLAACQAYMRHRDIWDLRWLKLQGATVQADLIFKKIKDYKVENYPEKLNKLIKQLNTVVHSKAFKDQMSRFIPMDVQDRTLKKSKFLDNLAEENNQLLLTVRQLISNKS